MKKLLLNISALLLIVSIATAQETVYPAPANKGKFYIKNGTVHIGNGQVLENATIEVNNGKIVNVGTNITPASGAEVIDATGKQIYPGLILPSTDLGLKEIANGVRGSNDYTEIGEYNPSVRSITAYNTDSRVIRTLLANGIYWPMLHPKAVR